MLYLSRFLRTYENTSYLIQRKVTAFLIAYGAIVIGILTYIISALSSPRLLMDDGWILGLTLLGMAVSFFLFQKGYFTWAVNTLLGILLVSATSLVYFGQTVNELKLYNMAFLQSLALVFSILVAQKAYQIFTIGITSFTFITLYMVNQLLPMTEAPFNQYSMAYVAVGVITFMETMIGIQIHRVLNSSIEEIEYKAHHHESTNLFNRTRFLKDIKEKFYTHQQCRFIFYKLDNYNELLISLGNQKVIEILQVLESRFRNTHNTTFYQVNEDTLVGILKAEKRTVITEANQQLLELKHPLSLEGFKVQIILYAALIEQPCRQGQWDNLLNKGRLALYQGRKEKKGFSIFEESREKEMIKRIHLLNELSEALQVSGFTVMYQPIVNVKKEVVYVEALARWKRPDGTTIRPDIFINLLEEAGMIEDFFQVTFQIILKDIKRFPYFDNIKKIFVNLSPIQFTYGYDLDSLFETLKKADISPDRIGFEITESALFSNETQALQTLRLLSDYGFELALDDFGTGYSNLSRILNLPIKRIKFDKSFLEGIREDSRKENLIRTLIPYFKKNRFSTLIEGVERESQFKQMKELGFDYFQGFLFDKPSSPKDLQ